MISYGLPCWSWILKRFTIMSNLTVIKHYKLAFEQVNLHYIINNDIINTGN